MRGAAQPNAVQVLSSNSFRNNARVCVCVFVDWVRRKGGGGGGDDREGGKG